MIFAPLGKGHTKDTQEAIRDALLEVELIYGTDYGNTKEAMRLVLVEHAGKFLELFGI